MRILTYSNPFALNQNHEVWNMATSHPHFCASDTLVQGLTRCYSRESFTHIRPLQELLDAFLGNYTNNPLNDMQLFLKASSIMHSWPDSTLKQSFLFNKADVVNAIQLLIPLECDPSNFEKDLLSKEQAAFLDIYEEIYKSDCYSAFSSLLSLSKEDYIQAVTKTTINEINYICGQGEDRRFLQEKGFQFPIKRIETARQAANILLQHYEQQVDDFWGCSTVDKSKLNQLQCAIQCLDVQDDFYYSKIIIHGVHRITPIIYFLFNTLQNRLGIEVIFLINYASNIPEIYGTWKRVYSWCNAELEYASHINLDSGKDIGKEIALVLSGQPHSINLPDKIIKYDNLSSFALHEVSEQFKSSGENLSKMGTQYYAVNGRQCNDILQMYFPEQFGKKPFLSYPIGQFILGLYNMWDFKSGEVKFDFSSLTECATSGLFRNSSNIAELLRKTQLYISDVTTYKEYVERLSILKKAINGIVNDPLHDGWKKVSFFSLSKRELDDLSDFITSINSISSALFSDVSPETDYVSHFRKLMELISENTYNNGKISEIESQLVVEISDKLSINRNEAMIGNSQDLKDALLFFLKQNASKDSSMWIVRDFEQIDGAVLLSNYTKAKYYHFALLSNEHMLKSTDEELPWPLTQEIFSSYSKVEEGLTAISSSLAERHDFFKYCLFYGAFFSNKEILFSYIEEENEEKQTPYYVFKALGLNEESGNRTKLTRFIVPNPKLNTYLKEIQPSPAERELFSVCPFKYLLNSVLKADILYSSEFHLKYYLSFAVADIVRRKTRNNSSLFQAALKSEIELLREYFPFWGDVIIADINNSAKKSLDIKYKTSEKIARRKRNFLIAQWRDPETKWELNFEKSDLAYSLREYLKNGNIYPDRVNLPCRAVCDDCNFSDICLRNYYEAHAELDSEVPNET